MLIGQLVVQLLTPLAETTSFGDANKQTDPRITYHIISDNDNSPMGPGTGPRRHRVQIDVWSLSLATASLLAESARIALRTGAAVAGTLANPDGFDSESKFHSKSFDAFIWTQSELPT